MTAIKKTSTVKANANVTSIAQQQLSVLQTSIKALQALDTIPDTIAKIKDSVEEIKTNFAYQLQEEQVKQDEAIKALTTNLEEHRSQTKVAKENIDNELEEKRIEFNRQIEQLEYNNNILIRDKKLETATAIAKEYKMILADKKHFEELEMLKRSNDEELKEIAEKTELVVTEKITNNYEIRIKELEANRKLEEAKLRKDIEAAQKEIKTLNDDKIILARRIEEMTAAMIKISDNATRPNTIINETVRK